jgi:hypothetical protein
MEPILSLFRFAHIGTLHARQFLQNLQVRCSAARATIFSFPNQHDALFASNVLQCPLFPSISILCSQLCQCIIIYCKVSGGVPSSFLANGSAAACQARCTTMAREDLDFHNGISLNQPKSSTFRTFNSHPNIFHFTSLCNLILSSFNYVVCGRSIPDVLIPSHVSVSRSSTA